MSTGEKCANFHTGQAVAYFKFGSFSEYMVLQFVFFNEIYGLSNVKKMSKKKSNVCL